MLTETKNKSCRNCGKTVKGRSDKKFCDDGCRNQYNNQLKAGEHNYVRTITNQLRKNRRILQELLPADTASTIVHRTRLADQGFRFGYATQVHVNRKGKTYLFCYEFGYLGLSADRYLVMKKNERPDMP